MQADHTLLADLRKSNIVTLINAEGRKLTPLGTTTVRIDLGIITVDHTLVVVEHLSTPVILGCDFLTTHGVILDFKTNTTNSALQGSLLLQPPNSCMLILDDECPQAMPSKALAVDTDTVDMPTDYHPALRQVLQDNAMIFRKDLGRITITEHVIETGEASPVKVPARPIPFHYMDRVHNQLQEMAQEGIIRCSNSPWCAPAVYVPKSNGEIRICVDFVQLNKVTKKDAYPVPRAEGPQQRLANKQIFSKIDLKSAYWQFPMSPTSIEKTAFCPGPGYGLWEFTVMPYGLTGATQTCQRGLDQVLKDCKDCVDNYIDDCIVFSDNMQSHVRDLHRVLSRLRNAGFTLRGSKCFFGKTSLSHLGFQYSPDGVTPTADKTQSILNWPIPASRKELRSFLGLVNFYRRFIPRFSHIAAPLTSLTANKVPFKWNQEHQVAFEQLRQALVSPPILDYPKPNDHFILTTDASDVGLGAILSTARGTTIEYASRTLTAPETKFSTIEKECLAIVWAIRKFRHYLLGARFTLRTDHKPLEWLDSAKKSRSHSQRLERWSLELRAYEFSTTYLPKTKWLTPYPGIL